MNGSSAMFNGITANGVSAACKLFNDSSNKCIKTPISLLQEICTKSQSQPPIYELLKTEGRSHEPFFVYKCTLGPDCHVNGKGTSKKKAKHAAALGILNLLIQDNKIKNPKLVEVLEAQIETLTDLTDLDIDHLKENLLPDQVLSDPDALKDEIAKSVRQDSSFNENGINPVGELIEIAQRCSLRPPDFEFGDEEGPPHNRQFICRVRFGPSMFEEACGRSKKIAKRIVAQKLLETIKHTPEIQEQLRAISAQTNGHRSSNVGHVFKTGITSGSQATNSVKHGSNKRVTIMSQLKQSKNSAALILLDPSIELSEKILNKKLFDSLVEQERISYKFYTPDKNYVLLALDTNPVITTLGKKTTGIQDCLMDAIHNVLLHLRLMCISSAGAR